MLHLYSYNKVNKTVSHMAIEVKEAPTYYEIDDRDIVEKVLSDNFFVAKRYSKDSLPIVHNNDCISILMEEGNHYKAMEYIKTYIQDDIAVWKEKIRKSLNIMEDIEWGSSPIHI